MSYLCFTFWFILDHFGSLRCVNVFHLGTGRSTLRVFSVIALVITGIMDVSFPRDSLWPYSVSIDNQ